MNTTHAVQNCTRSSATRVPEVQEHGQSRRGTGGQEGGGRRGGTHHLDALDREERVLVWPRTRIHGLAIDAADLARVREEDPDRVEGDGEEVAEEHEWCLVNTVESTHVSGDTQAGLGGKLTQKAG